jgi:hypothetical protein
MNRKQRDQNRQTAAELMLLNQFHRDCAMHFELLSPEQVFQNFKIGLENWMTNCIPVR